jgi:hypothetical protein
VKKSICGLALTFTLIVPSIIESYAAVVTSPVADLIFQPMSELKDQYKKGFSYEQIPVSGESIACPRAHQLRANDLVDVVEERDDEVRVFAPSFFYLRRDTIIPQHHYWMRKKDLMALQDIPICTPHQSSIPEAIVVQKPIPYAVTLSKPWYDRTTKTQFSAGTRFASDGSDEKHHHIFVFNPHQKHYVRTSCPLSYCLIPSSTLKEQRKQMIDLARSWTTNKDGFIPYAWGGTSIGKRVNYPRAHDHKIQRTDGTTPTYYEWPGRKSTPKTGIDCSGLILLAAQSVGIPYFCKNSYTAETTLRPVRSYDDLEIGDVIMFRGHVMLVADLERNTLIEARGYGDGYGKVHEIPLSEEFNGINTYEELIARIASGEPIERLDKERNVRDPLQIKLLKLAVE